MIEYTVLLTVILRFILRVRLLTYQLFFIQTKNLVITISAIYKIFVPRGKLFSFYNPINPKQRESLLNSQ